MGRLVRDHPANAFLDGLCLHTPSTSYYAVSEKGCVEVSSYTYSKVLNDWENKTKQMKIGRLIKTLRPEINDVIVEEITKLYEFTQGVSEFEIATSEEDILEVYKNGPRSCMVVYQEDRLGRLIKKTPVNGVRAYSMPGIALAYLGTKEKPTARCVINTIDKKYTRVYGNSTLEVALKNSGYEYSGQSLSGLKLKKIKHSKEFECDVYELPYLDCVGNLKIEDDGFLVLPQHRERERTNGYGEAHTGLTRVPFRGELHDIGMAFKDAAQSYDHNAWVVDDIAKMAGKSAVVRFKTIMDGVLRDLKHGEHERANMILRKFNSRIYHFRDMIRRCDLLKFSDNKSETNIFNRKISPALKIIQTRGAMTFPCSVETRILEVLREADDERYKRRQREREKITW